MQLIVNDVESQAPVILHPPPMTDDEFFDFCQLYPEFRVERSVEGEVIIMPGTGLETSYRNNELSAQLRNWAIADGRGSAFDSNAEFILPSGAALSPDASWIDNSRLARLSREQKRKFPRICPDFVIELTSPSDRLPRVQNKMREWIENGSELGWLLDAEHRTAYIYRLGRDPRNHRATRASERRGARRRIHPRARTYLGPALAYGKGGSLMRSFAVIFIFACSTALRAQNDFSICQGAGAETSRQGGPTNPQREFCIGYVYAFGRGVPKDMSAAIAHFRYAADRGYTPAQAVLGLHYAKGLGVAQNWTEAARWYRKAADAGHAGAAVNLGLCYQNGNGVPQDRREAAKWYKIAVDRGDPSAAGLLGALGGSPRPAGSQEQAKAPANDLFQQGVPLYKAGDFRGALRYFQRAAEAGNSWAELQIGYQYENAEGLPQNYSEAVKWYARSAQHGNARGQKNIGQMYESGQGVPEDWVTAARWYQKSADQNWLTGQYALGRAYQFGIGVPQSRQKAIEWFRRAAANGDSEAAYFAQDLSSPGNFIGFRNVPEHDMVIGGKLRFGLIFQEPAGMVFHNSGERNAYLRGVRRGVDSSEATTMWNIRKSSYDACRSSGGSNCQPPGPPPR